MTREGYEPGTSQENGRPAMADILDFLVARGIECVTLDNPNYYSEGIYQLWDILNALDWAVALGVYCPSTTTFNVRGGRYMFGGEVKTYTPGSAVNPTDNDTTYIWMNADNTIESGIDSDGWPSTDHIKLAEIEVDSDGVITSITDLRGQMFLRDNSPKSLQLDRIVVHNGDVVTHNGEIVVN